MRFVPVVALLAVIVPVHSSTIARTSQAEMPQRLSAVPLTVTTPRRVIRFQAEVARTSDEQAKGLMFRRSLPANRGMLFPLQPQRVASFWMKNCVMPIDMIFVRADGSVARVGANARPQSLDPVTSGEPVAAVFEISGGQAAKLGIDERARVSWQR